MKRLEFLVILCSEKGDAKIVFSGQRAEALAAATEIDSKGFKDGEHVEVVDCDKGNEFIGDGSMKAYLERKAADDKAKLDAARAAEKEARDERIKALEAEIESVRTGVPIGSERIKAANNLGATATKKAAKKVAANT